MNSYKLLVETFEDVKIEQNSEDKNMYIHGLGLRAEIENKNGRVYPQLSLYEAVDKHIFENFSLGRCVGELEHPKVNAHEINTDRMSHRFVDVKKDGNNIWLEAMVLNTREGKQLKNIIKGGVQVGFSSRCLGQVKNVGGQKIVQPGLKVVSLADVVMNPSVDTSVIDAIYEQHEWVYENGVLVEKDLSEDIDNYKKMIESTTKKDRAKIFEKIVTDYFNKILK